MHIKSGGQTGLKIIYIEDEDQLIYYVFAMKLLF
jgi:hypothetical protein